MKVKCPSCQTEVVWQTSNTFRPFCSERCKLIDLGEWADENNRIAGKPDPSQMENMTDEELFALMAKMQVDPTQD
ncbi:DNA gyrase inhibitor YacG [Echinimonas agarilytica]|uniref:DNA gyrase inhibitor YacG n=1 Tax=Echinimonas agarilytica TaxID=1215918 RepID=A0AA42B6H4_9GAMM|nr:DNA gyrase inhibitor YacG [Echinimonas agarilytica]MCM2678790.1 DNA gyrase inhibitor YacG [Echinimonas agarilytica]